MSSEWPQPSFPSPGAAIVANAARDHEKAVEWALSRDAPVLVEKPIALTAAAAQRLATLAGRRNLRFAAAHVFLFARYLERLAELVAGEGTIKSLRVEWIDPEGESRYGEQKRYDPTLPILADCLPHVLSIAGLVCPGLPQRCEKLEFLRGGAHVKLALMLGDVPCSVELERDGNRRQRTVEVTTERHTLRLDFSEEPGIIFAGATAIEADPEWEVKSRPLARMLMAFLRWAAGGEYDRRLDVEIGVRASHVIDQAMDMYRSARTPWLIEGLTSRKPLDNNLHYALREMLQPEGSYSARAVEQEIDRVRRQLSGADLTSWARELAEAHHPSLILKALTMDS